MHEIEVKAVLRDKESIMRSLEAKGCVFSEPVTEEDTLYAEAIESMDTYNRNANFLRIRVRGDGTIIFTLKHHPERHEGRPDSMPLEHETAIASRDEMEHALLLMGYSEAVRISKTRQKAKIGNREVCIDEVAGLGSFIEIEELGSKEDTPRIVEELLLMLGELGIERKDMFADRYDIALLKRRFV